MLIQMVHVLLPAMWQKYVMSFELNKKLKIPREIILVSVGSYTLHTLVRKGHDLEFYYPSCLAYSCVYVIDLVNLGLRCQDTRQTYRSYLYSVYKMQRSMTVIQTNTLAQ